MSEATAKADESIEIDSQNKGIILLSNNQPIQLLDFGSNFLVSKLDNGQTVLSFNQDNLQTLLDQNAINLYPTNSLLDEVVPEQFSSLDNDTDNTIAAFKYSILDRLEKFEKRVDTLNQRFNKIETKLKNATSQLKEIELLRLINSPSNKDRIDLKDVTLVTAETDEGSILLNSERDYQNGSWLGDPNNPEKRVRCVISERDLEQLKNTCDTPEKLALTLLDYLFDRETQAFSNISGAGKHCKKQLDPLKIYGIYCHLIYRFNVDELQWKKIKKNIDSKCRSAFRRKLCGLSLAVKPPKNKSSISKMLKSNIKQDILMTDMSEEANLSYTIYSNIAEEDKSLESNSEILKGNECSNQLLPEDISTDICQEVSDITASSLLKELLES